MKAPLVWKEQKEQCGNSHSVLVGFPVPPLESSCWLPGKASLWFALILLVCIFSHPQ